ncbi:hypothetical protein MBLNU457_2335t1 [Dothideomycetes sp. NU457]
MSYNQSSGSNNQSNPGQEHALPARPAPPAGGIAFKPRTVDRPAAPAQATLSSAPQPYAYQQSAASSYASYGGASEAYGAAAQPSPYGHVDPYAGASAYNGQYATPPQIQNPFAPPSQDYSGSLYGANYDPAEAAQVQAWKDAYNYVPPTSTAAKTSATGTATTAAAKPKAGEPVPKEEAPKTVFRKGGGQTWEDPTLLEWGNHHRLFVGNLAGEVTDESLLKAFSKFPSVQKARVVRDKRTTKSKGFGFVSLADADDFFNAAKEMNGKYIGSHPVLVRKAETEIKTSNKKDDPRKKWNNKNKGGHGGGKGGQNDPLKPAAGGGVQKKAQQPATKYKLLG